VGKAEDLIDWVRKTIAWILSPSVWLLICLPLMGGCAWLFDPDNPLEQENIGTPDLPTIPYKASIAPQNGEMMVPEVDEYLKAVSLLLKLESRPPTSLNALNQRIKNDLLRLKQALAEKGYFDGQVDYSLKPESSPIDITLTYTLGKRYKISKITLMAEKDMEEPLQLTPSKAAKKIQLNIGDDVDLGTIHEANQRLRKHLRDHGYPSAEMSEPEGEIDRTEKRLHIIFQAVPGTRGTFGKAKISGLKNLDPQFVRNRIVWQEGELFDERKMEKTRRKLMGTGLFSAVEIKSDEETGKTEETTPIGIQAIEGPPRTIGAGLKYATTEGIGGQAFWSHKNIFGGGEGLNTLVRISPRVSKAKIDLDIPDVFAPEQHLRNELSATRDQNRAYTSRSFDAGVRLEHPFTDTLKGSVGVIGEVGRVKRSGVDYLNRLLGFPVEVQVDATNDLIDPTKGGRLATQVTPYLGRSGHDSRLLIATAKGSYYLRVLKSDAIILAGWAHGGVIATSAFDNIAPNKRFYAGGAGSVRAYGYKLLGPLDVYRVPLGGRSILEYGIEGRFKATETIGFVLFAEAGSLSTTASPNMNNQALLWGIGTGIRYYTAIGPIRVDVARPMKRRRDTSGKYIDSGYQFYLSVGQAF